MSKQQITYNGFFALKPGDSVYIKCGGKFYLSKVIREPFFNHDAEEPDWEVETTNGFSDQYSVYIKA